MANGKRQMAKENADASSSCFTCTDEQSATLLCLDSRDGTNRLTRVCVAQLTNVVESLAHDPRPLILKGNERFFSAGADLNEIAALGGADAVAFSRAGQRLMRLIDDFPALTIAAVSGYCLGGGLDLALACDVRIAAPNTVFGHRGASLGLITGWGGTQRLPRLIGKGRALQMFCAAEKIDANTALSIGLVHQVADDPVAAALQMQNAKFKMQK
jgi:enoyl-CoA hydratase/carnithine racemase